MAANNPFSIFIDMSVSQSLILLRGLPGAGKTALAEALSENGTYPVFSVDSYFTNDDGSYDFRYGENHIAYKECARQAEAAMKLGKPKIFLDNTFTMEWEMEPYFSLASQYGYRVFVVTVENRHKGVNVHGITEEQLLKMAEKYKVVLR
jgi:predicted kinase